MIRRVFTVVNVTALMLSITGVLYIGNAHAAAFQLKENSAKALGRSFAGAASAQDDDAIIVNNPASMRQLDGRQFQADSEHGQIFRRISWESRNLSQWQLNRWRQWW